MVHVKRSLKTTLFLLGASLAVSTLTAPSAHAQKTPSHYLAETWLHHFYGPFIRQIGQLPNPAPATPEEQRKCDEFYSSVRQKGNMKIVMGIGYYDSSEGGTYAFNYYPDGSSQLARYEFGVNATMDIAYEIMFRKILTSSCSANSQLCGFTETSPGVYSKMVRDRNGQQIPAIVEIRNSSVDTVHSQNVGPLLAQQTAKSDATTRWFFGSIPSADLAIYNGHSRKGGGPDFHPPRLRPDLHVDYSYYERRTPGLNRLLEALRAPTKPAAFMMMSCNSRLLFSDAIARIAPGVAFSGTNAIIPGDIPNKGAIASMDSFLRFQCQAGFHRAMHTGKDLREQLSLPAIE